MRVRLTSARVDAASLRLMLGVCDKRSDSCIMMIYYDIMVIGVGARQHAQGTDKRRQSAQRVSKQCAAYAGQTRDSSATTLGPACLNRRTSMRNHQTSAGVPRSWSANIVLTVPARRWTSHQRAKSALNSSSGRCGFSCGCSRRLVTNVASIASAPKASHAAGTAGSATHCGGRGNQGYEGGFSQPEVLHFGAG